MDRILIQPIPNPVEALKFVFDYYKPLFDQCRIDYEGVQLATKLRGFIGEATFEFQMLTFAKLPYDRATDLEQRKGFDFVAQDPEEVELIKVDVKNNSSEGSYVAKVVEGKLHVRHPWRVNTEATHIWEINAPSTNLADIANFQPGWLSTLEDKRNEFFEDKENGADRFIQLLAQYDGQHFVDIKCTSIFQFLQVNLKLVVTKQWKPFLAFGVTFVYDPVKKSQPNGEWFVKFNKHSDEDMERMQAKFSAERQHSIDLSQGILTKHRNKTK